MGLKERFYDRLGFKRESTINSMKANQTLKNGDIVKVAETGYFYDIKESSTSIPLNNGLFAEVKQTTFLQIVTNCINNLSNLTQQFNAHKETMATLSQNGHMSASDKSKLDGIANNANNYSLPIASSERLGGVKIGKNLSITEDGTLNAQDSSVQTNKINYRIHPDGFKEAWGDITTKSGEQTTYIDLPFSFESMNYSVTSATWQSATPLDAWLEVTKHTKNQIKARANDTPMSRVPVTGHWRVCGY